MPETDRPQPESEDGDSPDNQDLTDLTDLTENEPILSQPVNKGTEARLRRFLDAYAQSGFVNQSCETAGVSRGLIYHKLKTDVAFQHAFAERQHQVGQLLEDEIVRQALAGDSHLLLAAVRRFRPEWREKLSAEISGTINLVDRMTTAVERVRVMRRHESAERAG